LLLFEIGMAILFKVSDLNTNQLWEFSLIPNLDPDPMIPTVCLMILLKRFIRYKKGKSIEV